MKFIAGLSLATSALALSIERIEKRDSPLSVNIESVGNSAVKATIVNTGSSAVKVFKTGTILDDIPVEKTKVFAGCKYLPFGTMLLSTSSHVVYLYIERTSLANTHSSLPSADQVAFDGVRVRVQTTGLAEDSFQTIEAGETVEVEWDPAVVHDLSAGGAFDFVAEGSFLTAALDSTDITGAVDFASNKLASTVDGVAAAAVRRDFHEQAAKRSAVQSDCTGTQRTATVNALSSCRSLAAQASTAAASGAAAKLTEYFKSSTSATRSSVAAVFSRIVSECGSSTSGVADYYCSDVYSSCKSNVLAYTLPSQSYMVNCPLYFSALSALSSTCHAQDQATTTLHEVTHLSQIAGTDDLGYGYSAATSLSASQALNNADTYALFANGELYLSCHVMSCLAPVLSLENREFADQDFTCSYIRWMLNLQRMCTLVVWGFVLMRDQSRARAKTSYI